jgi:phosphatidylserine/phosphatidylglycerophosphate/cardiolipin synthase-like enzyme
MRWWISGGHALELHVGRTWRHHEDTDVGIVRDEAPRLREVLAGWEVWVAAAGELRAWDGAVPVAEHHENNLWCRRRPGAPWALDVTIGDGDATHWTYRRDPRLRVPWAQAVRRTATGVPYLAPDLQLLFKAMGRRPKDTVDADIVIPALGAEERARLRQWLPTDHPWIGLVEASGP